jgi:hypothetical protein
MISTQRLEVQMIHVGEYSPQVAENQRAATALATATTHATACTTAATDLQNALIAARVAREQFDLHWQGIWSVFSPEGKKAIAHFRAHELAELSVLLTALFGTNAIAGNSPNLVQGVSSRLAKVLATLPH